MTSGIVDQNRTSSGPEDLLSFHQFPPCTEKEILKAEHDRLFSQNGRILHLHPLDTLNANDGPSTTPFSSREQSPIEESPMIQLQDGGLSNANAPVAAPASATLTASVRNINRDSQTDALVVAEEQKNLVRKQLKMSR
ncbi:unnamed protein product, partial [Amoebophrya sp. A120]